MCARLLIFDMISATHQKLQYLLSLAKQRPKLSIALTIGLVFTLAVRRYQRHLVYLPVINGMTKSPSGNPQPYQNPSQHLLNYEDIQMESLDGTILRGWHIINPDAKRLILYFHENAGNIGTRLPFVEYLSKKTSADVLLVAYRGYSDSEGTPSESGLKKDCVAILKRALQLGEERGLPVVVFGRSLGGAAAIYSCSKKEYGSRIKGIILENTFTSIHDVVVCLVPWAAIIAVKLGLWMLLTNKWNSYKLMPGIRKPVLFIKSERDELIPKSHMDKLQELCEVRNYELVIPEGTHNVTWSLNPDKYFRELDAFLSKL